jgi:hypothetical protein
MIAPGGTPSVKPVRVATYTGLLPAMTFSEVDPGNVVATIVHGFVPGDGGCAQPTIGEPTRSGSQRTGPPPASTCACLGMSVTRPPCAQRIVALPVTTGGTTPSIARARARRKAVTPWIGHVDDLLTPLGKSGIFHAVERSLVPPRRDLHVVVPA